MNTSNSLSTRLYASLFPRLFASLSSRLFAALSSRLFAALSSRLFAALSPRHFNPISTRFFGGTLSALRNMFWIGGAVLALAWIGACTPGGSTEREAPSDPPRNVRVLEVRPSSLDEYLQLSGPAHALKGTDLASEESGIVASIPRDKGSPVRKGETVVLLSRDILEAEMKAAEADRLLAEFNESRTQNLFDANSVSGQEMLQARTILDKMTAAAQMARVRYERAAISAPYSGVVTERYVEPGEFVAPGTPVVRIVDPFTLAFSTSVTEQQVASVREGMPVRIRFDTVAGEATGRVAWVGFEADPRTGKFPVEVHLDNSDLRIRPGVVGRARVPLRTHEQVLAIPRDAVIPADSGPVVFVVEDDVARRREVELGPDQGLMVVVESGLRAGDRIIVRGQRDVIEGDAVVVTGESTAADGGTADDPLEIRQESIERGRHALGSGDGGEEESR